MVDHQLPTWPEDAPPRGQHGATGGVVEVAERRKPVDDRVERTVRGELPHVRKAVVDRPAGSPGHLEEARAAVDPDHLEVELGEPVSDAAVTAGNVEHPHAGLELEKPDDQVHLDVRALVGQHVLGEMEVVVAEDLVEVEAGHGPV